MASNHPRLIGTTYCSHDASGDSDIPWISSTSGVFKINGKVQKGSKKTGKRNKSRDDVGGKIQLYPNRAEETHGSSAAKSIAETYVDNVGVAHNIVESRSVPEEAALPKRCSAANSIPVAGSLKRPRSAFAAACENLTYGSTDAADNDADDYRDRAAPADGCVVAPALKKKNPGRKTVERRRRKRERREQKKAHVDRPRRSGESDEIDGEKSSSSHSDGEKSSSSSSSDESREKSENARSRREHDPWAQAQAVAEARKQWHKKVQEVRKSVRVRAGLGTAGTAAPPPNATTRGRGATTTDITTQMADLAAAAGAGSFSALPFLDGGTGTAPGTASATPHFNNAAPGGPPLAYRSGLPPSSSGITPPSTSCDNITKITSRIVPASELQVKNPELYLRGRLIGGHSAPAGDYSNSPFLVEGSDPPSNPFLAEGSLPSGSFHEDRITRNPSNPFLVEGSTDVSTPGTL